MPVEWTGNPECWICHKEYEPLMGDGDGACAKCYNGWTDEEDEPPDLNREGDPAFNGAFDRW